MLLINLALGLSQFWSLLLLGKQHFLFNIFKGCAWNKICSLDCVKAKNEEKLLKKFSFDQVKNKFAHFGGLKYVLLLFI